MKKHIELSIYSNFRNSTKLIHSCIKKTSASIREANLIAHLKNGCNDAQNKKRNFMTLHYSQMPFPNKRYHLSFQKQTTFLPLLQLNNFEATKPPHISG